MELPMGLACLLDLSSQQLGYLVRSRPVLTAGGRLGWGHARPQLLDLSAGLTTAQIGSTVSRPVVVAVAIAWLQRSR